MKYFLEVVVLCLLYIKCEGLPPADDAIESWLRNAKENIKLKLSQKLNQNKAKNIILFLGDGMSNPTITAARFFKQQREHNKDSLSFEKFPFLGLSKTYCADAQIADSACSATAYLGGVKANIETIGVSSNVKLNDCVAAKKKENQVESIAAWAQSKGMSTGIVTTTTVTDASPAGVYSHTSHRNFRSDFDIRAANKSTDECEDIAKQLIFNEPGRNLNVILGGGRESFLPNTTKDGNRLDNMDLIKHWKQSKSANANYVTDRTSLLNVDVSKTEYLLGLFHKSDLSYHLDRMDEEPSLEEMMEVAIKILQKNKNGFFLFVEGGLIDRAHHDNLAFKAFDETIEFSNAIQKAVDMTDEQNTLLVVTADHAHVMSMSGYSDINNPITGISNEYATDKLPYMTISYANGPSAGLYSNNGQRDDLRLVANIGKKDFKYPSLVPLKSETHGGDDVAVFARGPWAHLFSGVIEQNDIPVFMGYAGCIGNGLTSCLRTCSRPCSRPSSRTW